MNYASPKTGLHHESGATRAAPQRKDLIMGSIEDLFQLFVNGLYGLLDAGSSAVGTGSTVAEGVLGTAVGSIGNIVTGPGA